jgi:CelD/BcsL family acetyltransferase involved in cellulose biosynthesis
MSSLNLTCSGPRNHQMPATTNDKGLVEVRIATSDQFIQSRETWNALAAVMKYPTIFCSWEWIHTWWNHFGKAHEPAILFVYRRGELTGILPLFLENRREVAHPFPRRLGFCGSTKLYPDHLDIICAGDDAKQCLDAAFDFLTTDFRCWDILQLSFIAEDSYLYSWLWANRDRIKWRIKDRTVAPYLNLAGSFDDYMGRFTSRQRYPVQSRRKKLLERHAMRYAKCDSGDLAKCLTAVFDLHAQRAVAKRIDSTFTGDEIFQFHVDLLREIQNKHWVWIRFLKIGEEMIAAFYGFVFGNRVFYYQLGHDPEWASFSPGMVMLYETIQESFAGNYLEFNFLQGEEEFKYKWTKDQRILYDFSVYQNNLRSRALFTKDILKQALKKVLGRHPRAESRDTQVLANK